MESVLDKVLRRRVTIRASDRVVGGCERVVEDYVSHRFLPVAQDHRPKGDDEPIKDAEPAAADDEPWVQSEDMRGLIEILRNAAIGDEILQEFKASADPIEAVAQTQQDSRIADGRRTESRLNYSQLLILRLRK
jgi:hypothetical protein